METCVEVLSQFDEPFELILNHPRLRDRDPADRQFPISTLVRTGKWLADDGYPTQLTPKIFPQILAVSQGAPLINALQHPRFDPRAQWPGKGCPVVLSMLLAIPGTGSFCDMNEPFVLKHIARQCADLGLKVEPHQFFVWLVQQNLQFDQSFEALSVSLWHFRTPSAYFPAVYLRVLLRNHVKLVPMLLAHVRAQNLPEQEEAAWLKEVGELYWLVLATTAWETVVEADRSGTKHAKLLCADVPEPVIRFLRGESRQGLFLYAASRGIIGEANSRETETRDAILYCMQHQFDMKALGLPVSTERPIPRYEFIIT